MSRHYNWYKESTYVDCILTNLAILYYIVRFRYHRICRFRVFDRIAFKVETKEELVSTVERLRRSPLVTERVD